MSHADLQNISEIIKILNQVFQGLIPESEKYIKTYSDTKTNLFYLQAIGIKYKHFITIF